MEEFDPYRCHSFRVFIMKDKIPVFLKKMSEKKETLPTWKEFLQDYHKNKIGSLLLSHKGEI